jgi:hypothetical protein
MTTSNITVDLADRLMNVDYPSPTGPRPVVVVLPHNMPIEGTEGTRGTRAEGTEGTRAEGTRAGGTEGPRGIEDFSFGNTVNGAQGNAIILMRRLGFNVTDIDFNMEALDQDETRFAVWIGGRVGTVNVKIVLNRRRLEQVTQLPVSAVTPIDETVE